MSEYAGAVRTQRGLAAAKAVIDAIGAELDETRLTDPYTFKVYNMYMNAAAHSPRRHRQKGERRRALSGRLSMSYVQRI